VSVRDGDIAATDDDPYSTLVTTVLAPKCGRENVFQSTRAKPDSARHQLPNSLGGRPFGVTGTYHEIEDLLAQGWTFRVTRLTREFTLEDWRAKRPDARILGRIAPNGTFSLLGPDTDLKGAPEMRIVSFRPPAADDTDQPPAPAGQA